MKKLTMTASALLLVFALTGISFAADFSGGWLMNANSATFALHIEQVGTSITGEMIPINGDPVDAATITGDIQDGYLITFTRAASPNVPIPQIYEGALFLEQGSVCMAGLLLHENVTTLGWFACRQ
jgi:hypothetical protein